MGGLVKPAILGKVLTSSWQTRKPDKCIMIPLWQILNNDMGKMAQTDGEI